MLSLDTFISIRLPTIAAPFCLCPEVRSPPGVCGHKTQHSARRPARGRTHLQLRKSKLLPSFLPRFVISTKPDPSGFLKDVLLTRIKNVLYLYENGDGIISLYTHAFRFVSALTASARFIIHLIPTDPLLLPEVHFKAPKHELGAYKFRCKSKRRGISESHQRAAEKSLPKCHPSQQATTMLHGFSRA